MLHVCMLPTHVIQTYKHVCIVHTVIVTYTHFMHTCLLIHTCTVSTYMYAMWQGTCWLDSDLLPKDRDLSFECTCQCSHSQRKSLSIRSKDVKPFFADLPIFNSFVIAEYHHHSSHVQDHGHFSLCLHHFNLLDFINANGNLKKVLLRRWYFVLVNITALSSLT